MPPPITAMEDMSNCARMLSLADRGEGVIETHCDIADEETPDVADLHPGRRAADKAIGFEAGEGLEFAFEMRGEVDAKTLRHRRIIQGEITHDSHDGFTTDFVFITDDVAASKRDLAGVQTGIVQIGRAHV